MPDVTDSERHAVNADPITDAHVILLAFQEDGRSTVHRAALNNEDVVYNGNTYARTRIDIHLPGSSDDFPRVRLEMSNIPRSVGAAIAQAKNRIGCRLLLVNASDSPVTLVAGIDTKNLFVLSNAALDSVTISAELGARSSMQEPMPPQRTSQVFFPGVWFDQ